MESTTDAAEWKLEVERVLPLLKVHIRTDNKVIIFKVLCEIGMQNVRTSSDPFNSSLKSFKCYLEYNVKKHLDSC